MSTLQESITIQATPTAVWTILADFEGIAKWNPNLSASRLIKGKNGGVGAVRHCDFKGSSKGFVVERIITWQDGASYQVEIAGTDQPIKMGTMGFSVRADGAESQVTFAMDYTLKFGVIGKLMDAVMVRRQMRSAARDILGGLKTYAEEPAPVTPTVTAMARAK